MARYGYGTIDGFVLVFSPLAPVRWCDLVHHALDDPEGWAGLSKELPGWLPDPRFPVEGGILPFARSDNGDTFYWKAAGPADGWTTMVVDQRCADGRYDHPGGMVDLLAGLLSRTVPADIATEEFPSAAPRFPPVRK
jgi:hypothetical protein